MYGPPAALASTPENDPEAGCCCEDNTTCFPDSSVGYIADCRDESKPGRPVLPPREAYIKFLQTTTLHGIARLYEGGGAFRRIIWTIVFLSGLFFAIWFSKFLLVSYMDYDKRLDRSIEFVDNLKLPDITICGQAGVHQFDLPPLEYAHDQARPGSILRWSWGQHQADAKGKLYGLSWKELWIGKSPTTIAEMKRMSMTDKQIDVKTRCYFLNASQSQLPPALVAGFSTSLNVMIDLAIWNLTDTRNPFHKLPKPVTSGVSVDVTPPDGAPLPPNHGIPCSVGTECKIATAKSILDRMGDATGSNAWGNCQPVSVDKPYSVSTCKATCVREMYKKCDDFTTDTVVLAEVAMQKISKCMEFNTERHCSHCYPPCHDVTWTTKHALAPYDHIPFERDPEFIGLGVERWLEFQRAHQKKVGSPNRPGYINKNTGEMEQLHCDPKTPCNYRETFDYAEQNIITISVYPETLTVMHAREEAQVPFANLLATIGGNLGLFIGASWMTLFEWLEFSFVALSTYICASHAMRSSGENGPLLGSCR